MKLFERQIKIYKQDIGYSQEVHESFIYNRLRYLWKLVIFRIIKIWYIWGSYTYPIHSKYSGLNDDEDVCTEPIAATGN